MGQIVGLEPQSVMSTAGWNSEKLVLFGSVAIIIVAGMLVEGLSGVVWLAHP